MKFMLSKISSIAFVGCIFLNRYLVSGARNKSCVTNDSSCSVCCVDQKRCHHSEGFVNTCINGCIDGHRGARCYELCTFKCKNCDDDINKCKSCFDGFYPGVNKNCTSRCKPNCKECSNGYSCISCKEGFYNKDGTSDCRYRLCPTNCECSTGECVACKEGFYDIKMNCTFNCPTNCKHCSSSSQCNVCKDGYFNDNGVLGTCTTSCRDNCTKCSSYDDCSKCKQGIFGKQCDNICSTGCRNNECELETGKCDCLNNFRGDRCTECKSGWFGLSCDRTCPKNCNNSECGKVFGNCTEGCKSNTITGSFCDTCVTGKYGPSCNSTCPENCLNDMCYKENGTCVEGCNEGFDGPFCSECVQGKYGYECKEDCPEKCKNNECLNLSGHCLNCTGNFHGNICDICKPGFYGSDCEHICSSKCSNYSCVKDSGKCNYGCIDAYSGDKCCVNNANCLQCESNTICQQCSPGYFGKICNETCSDLCINNVCEFSTGVCTEGCTASVNEKICLRNQKERDTDKEDPFSFGFIAAGVLGGIAVIALCVLATFCLLKQRRRRRPFDRISSIPNSKKGGHVYENVSETHLTSDPNDNVGDIEAAANSNTASEDPRNIHKDGKTKDTARTDGTDHSKDSEAAYYNTKSEDLDSHRVKVTKLYTYVTKTHPDSLSTEFEDIEEDDLDVTKHCTVAMKDKNIRLNRFNGIYPYDHSRVKLAGLPNFFINACYIDGYNEKKAFIASLGPTIKTTDKFSNFWLMVWHEKSDIIVILTNLREVSGMKCEKYWPDCEKEHRYGQITVKCRSIEEFAEYTVRTFTISKGKEDSRNVIQLHYTAWPDKGVPQEVTSLVEFRQRVRIVPVTLGGPVIVHCSAGVGRTGTYIALDMQTDEGKEKGSVDVFNCVRQLRKQRVHMVQTAEQYMFLYKALVHSLTFECETQTAEEIQAFVYAADDQKFKDMYQLLQREIDTECKEDMDAREENRRRHKDRNRRHSDIPTNRSRVRLFVSRVDSRNDYINAVFINSFKTKDLFIAAQSPLANTVEDFLCMIYQQNCACVVALDLPLNQSKTEGKYLPADNETYRCGYFTVTSSKCATKQHYIVKKLTIQHSTQNEVKTVYHFQYKTWAEPNKVPDSIEDFVHFVKDVEKRVHQNTDDKPRVVVHCLTGYGKTGLFCTLFRLLEKLEAERQVSVVNAIRNVRTHRRQAITGEEQLKFCYQCISAYLEIYNTYSNFAT